MLDQSIPKALADNCLECVPPNEKVWALNIPITKMLISTLNWQFDIPFWKHGNKKYAITPNQVISNKSKYSYQFNRIMNADLKYPIDITKNHKGKWEILDGLHRLVKARIIGLTTVNVRKVSSKQLKKLLD